MMKITAVSLGNKMPDWVETACALYEKRLQEYVQFTKIDLPLVKRSKTYDVQQVLQKEMTTLMAAIPDKSFVIALDVKGKQFNSPELAQYIEGLQHQSSHLCFIIGGPEGLTDSFLKSCHARWSLSKLTLPHPFAKVMSFEAIYRAFAIINHHPYHK